MNFKQQLPTTNYPSTSRKAGKITPLGGGIDSTELKIAPTIKRLRPESDPEKAKLVHK